MRWVNLTIIVVFAGVILIFALQNLETVTVTFLGASISARVALLVFVAYILGAMTGGSLFALLRRSYHGAGRPRAIS